MMPRTKAGTANLILRRWAPLCEPIPGPILENKSVKRFLSMVRIQELTRARPPLAPQTRHSDQRFERVTMYCVSLALLHC